MGACGFIWVVSFFVFICVFGVWFSVSILRFVRFVWFTFSGASVVGVYYMWLIFVFCVCG